MPTQTAEAEWKGNLPRGTGRLKLGPNGQFSRGLLITLIDGGRLTVLGESRP